MWVVLCIQQIFNTANHKSPIYGLFTLYKRSQRDNIRQMCIHTPDFGLGVFYKNCGRINIITNNQSGKIIKVVKAAINNAKICKNPIAGYDKIIQNQPSPNNIPKPV